MKRIVPAFVLVAFVLAATVPVVAAPRERDRRDGPIVRVIKKVLRGVTGNGDWPVPPLPAPKP